MTIANLFQQHFQSSVKGQTKKSGKYGEFYFKNKKESDVYKNLIY